jgi:hypothetical protein
LKPFLDDGLQSLGSVGAVRLLHWKQKGWIRLQGEQNRGLQAVAELQAPETNDFHCPCVFAYAQLPPAAEVGAVVTVRMAVYLRVAMFGLSANEATRHLMEAVQPQHCHGGVIPTRSLPQSTNKYTRSDVAGPAALSAEEKMTQSSSSCSSSSGGGGALPFPAVQKQVELAHSSSVYVQFSKKKMAASSFSSSSSSSSSSFPSAPLKPICEAEVIDLVSSSDEEEEHQKLDSTPLQSSLTVAVDIASVPDSKEGVKGAEDNARDSHCSLLSTTAAASAAPPLPKLEFSTRSLLCAAECTGYPLRGQGGESEEEGGEEGEVEQPQGLAPGLVLRDYQVGTGMG